MHGLQGNREVTQGHRKLYLPTKTTDFGMAHINDFLLHTENISFKMCMKKVHFRDNFFPKSSRESGTAKKSRPSRWNASQANQNTLQKVQLPALNLWREASISLIYVWSPCPIKISYLSGWYDWGVRNLQNALLNLLTPHKTTLPKNEPKIKFGNKFLSKVHRHQTACCKGRQVGGVVQR